MNRRKFFATTALSAAGIMASDKLAGFAGPDNTGPAQAPAASYNLMQEVLKYRKIDAHVHVDLSTNDLEVQKKFAGKLLDYAERFGVEKLMLSKPVIQFNQGIPEASVAAFRAHNDVVLAIMKLHPDRFSGIFTLNPLDRRQALEEIRRCLDQGMAGAKLYYQVKINDPLYYPIIEQLIDRKVVIFSHAECQLGVGGYRMKYNGNKPKNVSTPEDFVDIARRYPEGTFQFAHIGGGGDWEYMCKALKDSPNVYVDLSGSNNEEHLIDFALRHLGEDRLLFGSDNCYYQAIGKVLASNLTEAQKKKVFFENYNNLLSKSGQHVN